MVNPLKTKHALDWGNTAREIEDQFQSGMIERDRYRKALEKIVLSANGFATCTVEYLEAIAEEALNPTK